MAEINPAVRIGFDGIAGRAGNGKYMQRPAGGFGSARNGDRQISATGDNA
jgi:hypothetical protein